MLEGVPVGGGSVFVGNMRILCCRLLRHSLCECHLLYLRGGNKEER